MGPAAERQGHERQPAQRSFVGGDTGAVSRHLAFLDHLAGDEHPPLRPAVRHDGGRLDPCLARRLEQDLRSRDGPVGAPGEDVRVPLRFGAIDHMLPAGVRVAVRGGPRLRGLMGNGPGRVAVGDASLLDLPHHDDAPGGLVGRLLVGGLDPSRSELVVAMKVECERHSTPSHTRPEVPPTSWSRPYRSHVKAVRAHPAADRCQERWRAVAGRV